MYNNKALKGIYALTPDMTDTPSLLHQVRLALSGGVRLIQYRNKLADAAHRLEQSLALQSLCLEFNTRLIINDDWQLAVAIQADGAHLGREEGDFAIARAARAALGAGKLLGISCYDEFSRAQQAIDIGADYVAFGTMFPSSTKPHATRASLALLTQAKRELNTTVVAIGGITLNNAPSVIAAGADMLAVISDLFNVPDVAKQAKRYGDIFYR